MEDLQNIIKMTKVVLKNVFLLLILYIYIYNHNCKNKNDCPLDGNCQTSDIIFKCIASTTINPEKIYLGTAEGNFKKRYYNQKTSFKNRGK